MLKIKNNSKSDYAEKFNKRYIDYINNYFLLKTKDIKSPKRKFNILVDCANGATSKIISEVLKDSFINIIPIYNEPSGKNINNNCGATHTDAAQEIYI